MITFNWGGGGDVNIKTNNGEHIRLKYKTSGFMY